MKEVRSASWVGAELLQPHASFRAPPSIQRFVNVHSRLRSRRCGGKRVRAARANAGRKSAGRPTIIACPVPKPYGDFGKIINSRIDESCPAPCRRLQSTGSINESAWTVEEEAAPSRSRRGSIAILFRRFRNFRNE